MVGTIERKCTTLLVYLYVPPFHLWYELHKCFEPLTDKIEEKQSTNKMALRYYAKLVKSVRLFEHAKARYRTLFGCLALSICFLLVVRRPYLEFPIETGDLLG